MARESVLVDNAPLVSRRYTCATSTGITKGTYLKYADPFLASASTGTGDIFCGFAHADVNSASDTGFNTETSITADKGGRYNLVASGVITVGHLVKTAAPGNYVMECTTADMASSLAIFVGVALETAAASETFLVEVSP